MSRSTPGACHSSRPGRHRYRDDDASPRPGPASPGPAQAPRPLLVPVKYQHLAAPLRRSSRCHARDAIIANTDPIHARLQDFTCIVRQLQSGKSDLSDAVTEINLTSYRPGRR